MGTIVELPDQRKEKLDLSQKLWVDWGSPEPIYFLKDRGGQSVEYKATYDYQHSEEYIKKMVAAGYNMCFFHFFKGYGLEKEDAEMKRSQEMAKIAKKYGVVMVTYMTVGSLTYPTIMAETNGEAKGWFQQNHLGEHNSCQVTYQSFRSRPCFNSKGYVNYMKRVIQKAAEMGSEMIHCDNVGHAHEPNVCRCHNCTEAFRLFLRIKYDVNDPEKKALGEERFGFIDIEYVQPPLFDKHQTPDRYADVKVPLHQEWIDFKCHVLADFFKTLKETCDENNLRLHMNSVEGPGFSSKFWRGNDANQIHQYADSLYSEEGTRLVISETGLKINRFRTFVMNEKVGRPCQASCRSLNERAEDALFASGNLLGVLPETKGLEKIEATSIFQFAKKHEKLLVNKKRIGRVAVLRSDATLSYCNFQPRQSACVMEQLLIQKLIPFRMIYDQQILEVSDVDLLILPAVRLMSEKLWSNIKEFVNKGGNVLATEDTAAYDQWYRQYPVSLIERDLVLEANRIGRKSGSYGKGQLVYLPEIEYQLPYTPNGVNWQVGPEFWGLPKNWRQVLSEVDQLSKAGARIEIEEHPSVVVDFFQENSCQPNWQSVHLQNLKGSELTEVKLKWRAPLGRQLNSAVQNTIDGAVELDVTEKNGWHQFTIIFSNRICLLKLNLQEG